ncbi:MAG: hypothetical protein HKN03_09940 [Acidimicrobiales bacterium]|nr:hypothetical protein [Acidimicrobiales bacterium]
MSFSTAFCRRGPHGRALAAVLAVAVVASASAAAAAPVATLSSSETARSDQARLSGTGTNLLRVDNGVIVVSNADLGSSAVTYIDIETLDVRAQQVVSGPTAAQGRRLAVIDVAGESAVEQGLVEDPSTPVLRLLTLPEADGEGFTEASAAVLPAAVAPSIQRFGTAIALGGNAIAVVSETTQRSDRVDIFTVTFDGRLRWAQQLEIGSAGEQRRSAALLQTNVAVSSSGAVIAASGVNRLAGSGEVAIFRIGTNGWIPTQRFVRIGGGPVVVDGERVVVQRSSFFVRDSGPWTVLSTAPGRPFGTVEELPVEGSSISIWGNHVAVGDPDNDFVYLLELSSDTGSYRFSQAIPVPGGNPGSGSPRFGTSVVLVHDRLVVGAPDATAPYPAGAFHVFDVVEGPVGCTIVGTQDDDDLRAPEDRISNTVCGLAGADLLIASSTTDRLDGGSGRDQCEGEADRITNCE